jgi:hypothetical protein
MVCGDILIVEEEESEGHNHQVIILPRGEQSHHLEIIMIGIIPQEDNLVTT